MKRTVVVLIWILTLSLAKAAELSTASIQELLTVYQQLRSIQGGGQAASAENVVFKRDAATFTFLNGRIVFAEPIAGRVLAAHFQGEGKFGLYVSLYKGGYVMEMLRVLLYDPKLKNPNARFVAMMHEFIARFAGQNASTEDFRKVVEKHAGKSMEWFFEQWVYGSETPVYDFSYQLANAEGGQTELWISLTQSAVSESFRMQLPLYIVVNGEHQFWGLVDVTGTKPLKTSIKLPIRPEKVLLDPERNILAEIHQ